jgi:Tfp pilus assembly PilM family ATPase
MPTDKDIEEADKELDVLTENVKEAQLRVDLEAARAALVEAEKSRMADGQDLGADIIAAEAHVKDVRAELETFLHSVAMAMPSEDADASQISTVPLPLTPDTHELKVTEGGVTQQ